MPSRFHHKMRRGTKSGKAQDLMVTDAAKPQGPVPYGARAQQGSCLCIGKQLRNGVGKGFRNRHVLRIAAVGIPARSPERLTQVFVSFFAKSAFTAG